MAAEVIRSKSKEFHRSFLTCGGGKALGALCLWHMSTGNVQRFLGNEVTKPIITVICKLCLALLFSFLKRYNLHIVEMQRYI